ncbi:MAG: phosphomannomutase/phosphoglucomutase [Actinomycetota bacterium]|nr:phosphomannomutase/phosphoglucomutase [Actinomycetota bacterium]
MRNSQQGSLEQVIKAYDIRGIYPGQLDSSLAYDVGAAFVQVLRLAARDGGPGAVVIAHDMRPSGPELVAAFADGVQDQGCDVVLIGLASTDGLYFASGRLNLPGAMFTASHNPAQYNGIKLCKQEASPVGQDTGLRAIRELIEQGVPKYDGVRGQSRNQDMLADYASYMRELVDVSSVRPLKVVVDAGNGMGGYTVPAVLQSAAGLPALPLDITPMYFELDGSFPNHEANPIDPETLVDLQAKVIEVGADLGLAFDGDADRCFVVDERGELVSPSTLTALIAVRELAKSPGSAVIHNLITSRSVPEVIVENGGIPIRTRVGHSFIKAQMAQTNAVFGGEHSGHFYFREFWRADSGMLAALHTISALGQTPAGTSLSSMLAQYIRYSLSGEINTEVADQAAVTASIKAEYGQLPGVEVDELDGLSITAADWALNVRPSNTEPLLRLNVEAKDPVRMAELRDELLQRMRNTAE